MSARQHIPLPYTPEQMKRLIEDALNDATSPATPQIFTEDCDFEIDSSPYKGRSSFPATSDIPLFHPLSPVTSPVRAFNLPNSLRKCTDSIASSSPYPSNDSPVRPIYSPSKGTDHPKRTFEVDASFLEALITLLERQAMIVPEHLFTQDEVREIVLKELQREELARKDGLAERVEDASAIEPMSPLTTYISLTDILMAAVGVAGMFVFRRAALAHPMETRWYALGALKGGVIGILGAVALKGVLRGFDELRASKTSRFQTSQDL